MSRSTVAARPRSCSSTNPAVRRRAGAVTNRRRRGARTVPPSAAGVAASQFKSECRFMPRIEGGRITGLVVRPEGRGRGVPRGRAARRRRRHRGSAAAGAGPGRYRPRSPGYSPGRHADDHRGTRRPDAAARRYGSAAMKQLSSRRRADRAAIAAPAVAQTTLNVRDADIRAFIADAAKVTGRTFIIDSRVQGKVTVVTDRPLQPLRIFRGVPLDAARQRPGRSADRNGAFRVQPTENAAAQPGRVGGGGRHRNQFVTEIVRLRSIDAQSGARYACAARSAARVGHRQSRQQRDRGGRFRRQCPARARGAAPDRHRQRRDAGGRPQERQRQGDRDGASGADRRRRGGRRAGGGTSTASVVAIESANAIAIRGDAATVARLAAIALDLDRKAKSGHRDPRRLPRECRCRAIAAGVAATRRAGRHSAS